MSGIHSNLESRDVTLEQSLGRSGDEEVIRWVATADSIDEKVGAETAPEALRFLADVLEESEVSE